jgi:preprotein translocase subunit SecF
MIVAGVCIVVAAFFLLRNDLNTAFVIAVLGLVAWFLNYRAQMKAVITAAEIQENSDINEKESYDDSDDD